MRLAASKPPSWSCLPSPHSWDYIYTAMAGFLHGIWGSNLRLSSKLSYPSSPVLSFCMIFLKTSYIPPNPQTLLLLTVASWPSILSPPLSRRTFHPPVASSFAYPGMCQIVLLLRTSPLVSASPCHVLLQLIVKCQNVIFVTVTLPGHPLDWL